MLEKDCNLCQQVVCVARNGGRTKYTYGRIPNSPLVEGIDVTIEDCPTRAEIQEKEKIARAERKLKWKQWRGKDRNDMMR
jgi:hypothetical protein